MFTNEYTPFFPFFNRARRFSGIFHPFSFPMPRRHPADGTYIFAEGATAFSQTVSFADTSVAGPGTLSVGEKATLGDTDYLLNLDNGTLSLRIGSDDEPQPEAEPGVKKLFFTGDFSGFGRTMLVVNGVCRRPWWWTLSKCNSNSRKEKGAPV